ncbi:DUF488 family protein [Chryseobacterium sp.]|uniref:DUF488 domain-containing protein n=1 Tax=Chryseobacterium sp. TaxID=1871047 RepID=UPI0025C0A05F|nr:DUF488 family protein [Chryseobacterium sp.]
MEITLKRIYEEAFPEDGYRVLVDRLWPRGISKEKAHFDEWNKELAPSTELRKWFHANPSHWDEFSVKYKKELKKENPGPEFIERLKKQNKITLLFASKDEKHAHPLVLREYLEQVIQQMKSDTK